MGPAGEPTSRQRSRDCSCGRWTNSRTDLILALAILVLSNFSIALAAVRRPMVSSISSSRASLLASLSELPEKRASSADPGRSRMTSQNLLHSRRSRCQGTRSRCLRT